MPDGYEFALFLHILGVLGIAGAAVTFTVTMIAMRRIGTVQELRSWSLVAVWSDRGFPLASVVVLAAGLYMVEDAWEWGDGWINTSLIALIMVNGLGGMLITPRVRKIREAVVAAADGPVLADVRRLIDDPVLWGTLFALAGAVVAIAWNMTTKPGDAQAGIVIVLGFVLGAGVELVRRGASGSQGAGDRS